MMLGNLVLILPLAAVVGAKCVPRTATTTLEFLGELIVPTGTEISTVEGVAVPLGGISGADYDACSDLFYLQSDDRSNIAPARFYTAKISTTPGAMSLNVTSVIPFRNPSGATFVSNSVDPESIRLSKDRKSVYWTSEGEASTSRGRINNPTVREADVATGVGDRNFSVPSHFLPVIQDTNGDGVINSGDTQIAGVRNNLAFEGSGLSPGSGRSADVLLYIGTENALAQDGPQASLTEESPARITVYDVETGAAIHEYVYMVGKIPFAPTPSDGYADNGLSELFSVGKNQLLTLERSYVESIGYIVKLFEVDLKCATDVLAVNSLVGAEYTPVHKTLLADVKVASGVATMENLECIAMKRGADGGLTLVLMSDNNFLAEEFTQVLAFKLTPSPSWATTIGKCFTSTG